MGQLGDLFPGPQLHEDLEDSGTGERFQPGSIDLESGVIRLAPRPQPKPAPESDETAD